MFVWVLDAPLKTVATGNWAYANNFVESKTFKIIFNQINVASVVEGLTRLEFLIARLN